MPTGILEVKIGRPYEMPARRMREVLEQVRLDCCVARNAAITHWKVWKTMHPEWVPGGPYDAPARKIKRQETPQGTPVDTPQDKRDPAFAPREFLSRELYRVATAAAPALNTSVCSSCVQEVIKRLKAKTPYNHEGSARFFWHAIMSSEVSLPTWRGGKIPAPCKITVLTYTDDECSIRFSLRSKKSGSRVLSPVVRLHSDALSRGRRRILKQLATGELRLADSQIVERNGKWYAQLCYDVPCRALGLPVDRVLTVTPSRPEDRRPFTATWRNQDGEDRVWGLGNGIPLASDYRRVQARRRALRDRSKDGCGKGHGKKRVMRNLKPLSRYVTDMCSRFAKQTIADIVALAIREKCGTVLYREPTKVLRQYDWFSKQDVPMDWTSFEARLSFRCQVSGLNYDVERIGMAEWRPKKDAG